MNKKEQIVRLFNESKIFKTLFSSLKNDYFVFKNRSYYLLDVKKLCIDSFSKLEIVDLEKITNNDNELMSFLIDNIEQDETFEIIFHLVHNYKSVFNLIEFISPNNIKYRKNLYNKTLSYIDKNKENIHLEFIFNNILKDYSRPHPPDLKKEIYDFLFSKEFLIKLFSLSIFFKSLDSFSQIINFINEKDNNLFYEIFKSNHFFDKFLKNYENDTLLKQQYRIPLDEAIIDYQLYLNQEVKINLNKENKIQNIAFHLNFDLLFEKLPLELILQFNEGFRLFHKMNILLNNSRNHLEFTTIVDFLSEDNFNIKLYSLSENIKKDFENLNGNLMNKKNNIYSINDFSEESKEFLIHFQKLFLFNLFSALNEFIEKRSFFIHLNETRLINYLSLSREYELSSKINIKSSQLNNKIKL